MSAAALIAALPMYDFPWVADADDALWSNVAERLAAQGVDAPRSLTRGADPHALWRDDRLLFGQTCGYPYATGLRERVTLLAAPEYAFPGCAEASHVSFLVAGRRDAGRPPIDFRGARAAINARDSNSGANVFRAAIAPLAQGRPFFRETIVTGAHVASLEAVSVGRADLAAIDCVSFALLARGRPQLIEGVAIVGECPRVPCLPFVASASLPAATLDLVRAALFDALHDARTAEARRQLGLVGARRVAPAEYEAVLDLERLAIEAGYPEVA